MSLKISLPPVHPHFFTGIAVLSTPAATDTMSGNPCTIHLGVGEQRMLRELSRIQGNLKPAQLHCGSDVHGWYTAELTYPHRSAGIGW